MAGVTSLDASVILAVLDPHDAHHTSAVALIRKLADGPYVMHSLTIAEVLVRAVAEGHGARRLADLKAIGVRSFAEPPNAALVLAELRVTTGLKMPDCCVLLTALQGTGELVTFDAGLARAAREQGIRVYP